MKQRLALLGLLVACQVAHLVASIWMLLAALFGSRRAWTIALGYDQLANAATGGDEDETISSRANRARIAGRRWGCVLCRFLDIFEKDHCRKSAGS